jgi:hypothetical protein
MNRSQVTYRMEEDQQERLNMTLHTAKLAFDQLSIHPPSD